MPTPDLTARSIASIPLLTDDALAARVRVRIAFTGRPGGVSVAPYDSLNLGSHVGDDLSAVQRNREILCEAMGCDVSQLLVPNQVHGTNIVSVHSSDELTLENTRAALEEGADAVVVATTDVAANLCFADCLPVIIVSPTGHFAVAHAGWRGAVAGIAGKAARALQDTDQATYGVDAPSIAQYNAYIGPHIRSCCFETGEDVAAQFAEAYGPQVVAENGHVDLAAAVSADLQRAGLQAERIADPGICTQCHADEYFSYRASGGVCGRQGAIALRRGA